MKDAMNNLRVIRRKQPILTVEDWIAEAGAKEVDFFSDIEVLKSNLKSHALPCYLQSVQFIEGCTFVLIHLSHLRDRRLLVLSEEKPRIETLMFEGESVAHSRSFHAYACEASSANAKNIRRLFPHTAPSPPLRHEGETQTSISFGLGDRLGTASFGHLQLFERYDIVPVLAQQSKRELNLTGRTYADIVDEASWDVFAYDYRSAWGADGDHLKSAEEIREALEMGCTMITADVSDKINDRFLVCGEKTLTESYRSLDAAAQKYFLSHYVKGEIAVNGDERIVFSEQDIMRIVLTYYEAMELAEVLYAAVVAYEKEQGVCIDFEFSIDETSVPTSLQAHYFVAEELHVRGIDCASLAPRFCGEFQKGIDYIGDTQRFEEELYQHAKIAEHFGYKISVHSGSDKFSIFPAIGAHLKESFHIKTSGTNWLVALQTIAEIAPIFFRGIYAKAYEVFDVARRYYHITPNFEERECMDELSDDQLYRIFENDCDRQVLHIAYGEVFKVASLKERIDSILAEHTQLYWSKLNVHIGRHIEFLGISK